MSNQTITRPTDYFGDNLARILSAKICRVYGDFDSDRFVNQVKKNCRDLSLTQRVELIADHLFINLPQEYKKATTILINIMGNENPNETGMFKEYYWLMPVGKYIEKYGLDNYTTSITAISELTKRNTGEYAIRPFIRKYPDRTLNQMRSWSTSDNFHLRRLASEGLRPKLPWALKLDLFVENYKPVFEILDRMKTEPVKFVKKSIANNLTDYIKLNPGPTLKFINKWRKNKNEHTQWIADHATRKF